jgi:hypothetical protein
MFENAETTLFTGEVDVYNFARMATLADGLVATNPEAGRKCVRKSRASRKRVRIAANRGCVAAGNSQSLQSYPPNDTE